MSDLMKLKPGIPDDDNRDFLPSSLIESEITVNENGNSSQPWPKGLVKKEESLIPDQTNIWYEYIPASYDGSTAVPLVVSLHGGMMTGWGQSCYSSWTMVADRDNVICVFPDASKLNFWSIEQIYDSGAPTTMPDGTKVPCPPEDYRECNELNWLKALIETMCERYNIDKERIYMQGMSMGSMMTAYFTRYYGYMLAGAAESASNTWPSVLYNEDGSIINRGGPTPVFHSRPELNGYPCDKSENIPFNRFNRTYWMTVNGCDPTPEISIIGEKNYAFYKGEKADYVYMDIKGRDHGQALDEAFIHWDYFFSGMRRKADGTIEQVGSITPREGDKFNVAFSEGVARAWWNNKAYDLTTAPMTWARGKYHGQGGAFVVRDEYLMVPLRFLAQVAGAKYEEAEDTLTAKLTLADGTVLEFARGVISYLQNRTLRTMYVEAIHRNGELLISADWFFSEIMNLRVSSCNGSMYVTDHNAILSYYMADIIREILAGENNYEKYIEQMQENRNNPFRQ